MAYTEIGKVRGFSLDTLMAGQVWTIEDALARRDRFPLVKGISDMVISTAEAAIVLLNDEPQQVSPKRRDWIAWNAAQMASTGTLAFRQRISERAAEIIASRTTYA